MSNTIKHKDIDYCDAYEGYEWDEFHVMRGDDGKLYTGTDSGCSCNMFWSWNSHSDSEWNTPDIAQPTECASWIEACNQARAWAGEDQDRVPAAMQLIERLTNTKPAAFDPSEATIDGELASKEIGA